MPGQEKKAAGPFGLAMMIIFWLAVLKYGYTGLTLLFLLFFLLGMFFICALKNKRAGGGSNWAAFWKALEDNNWVFRACFCMLLVSGFMWWITPGSTINPLKAALNAAKDLIEPTDPWASNGFWSFFLAGDGWGKVVMSYLWWTLLAIPVSFADEVKGAIKVVFSKKGEGMGMGNFLLKDGIAEILWKLIGIPFRRK